MQPLLRYAVLSALLCLRLVTSDGSFTNTIGMSMVKVSAGSFMMGYSKTPLPKDLTDDLDYRKEGDYDERAVHNVTISHDFYVSALEVTNSQYEMFNASHKALRGKLNFSTDDNEAAVFLSWYDAVAFCSWLSKRENRSYRLPTEAEWEYFARAGTDTYFNTGDSLPTEYWKCQDNSWYPGKPSPCPIPKLTTNSTPPNSFGLHEIHGNVEEWTLDWYDFYSGKDETDPAGPENGTFKVTRGGSHSTELYYLRSANRIGTLPEDNSWFIGMRVVAEDSPEMAAVRGEKPSPLFQSMIEEYNQHENDQMQTDQVLHEIFSDTNKMAPQSKGLPSSKLCMPEGNCSIDIQNWRHAYSNPLFRGPLQYVKIPKSQDDNRLPFSHHNHDPGICPCPNGDIFAIWYSTWAEDHRELGVVYSRLRNGSDSWDKAKIFWNAPDRNDHAPAMYLSPNGTMYHFNGLSAAATWGNLATIMRISTDNGYSWSSARLIFSEHGLRHMPVETVLLTKDGKLLLPTDAVTGGSGHTVIHLSPDMGYTWTNPSGEILGIHGAVVQLMNGSLYALGRGNDIDGHMAHSLSNDGGMSFQYSRSPFQGIHGGQREVLLRLKEGPIMMISFANKPMSIVDSSNRTRDVIGLFASVSVDEAKTWSNTRLITDDGKGRSVETLDGHTFTLSYKEAEPLGYMSARQSPVDQMIHVISSRQHYSFNIDWLLARPPPGPVERWS